MSHAIDSESLSKGKGKGKAHTLDDPTETTPLLPTPSSSVLDDDGEGPSPSTSRRRLISRLVSVFFITLGICVVLLVALALVARSYVAQISRISLEGVIKDDLKLSGPIGVNVLNVTDSGGIWTRIDGYIGLDATRALGVSEDSEDNLLTEYWKSFGRWGIRQLRVVSLDFSQIRLVNDDEVLLATLDLDPQEIPLAVDPPWDKSWLEPISTTVFLQPTDNTTDLISFLNNSWRLGRAIINVEVERVGVQGGALGHYSWRKKVQEEFSNIKTYLVLHLPQLPGLPIPGRGVPFPSLSDIITLESFSLSNAHDQLAVSASTTLVNPVPSLNFTVPSLPFSVSLPPDVPVAAVNTASFTTTHPNITIAITGSVLPLPPTSSKLLSTFLSRYLSALPNSIVLATPLIPNLTIDAEFPGPYPRPRVLRNVTIHDMKIKPGNVFLASGIVFARVVLPRGMDISLDVTHVLPDVLVFDGEAPESSWPYVAGAPPSAPPLPDPIPEHAFAHIRPDDWLDSECISLPADDNEEGATFAIKARLEDVPLQVLPGRETQFSNFISKVVFGKSGALAGLVGTVAVEVDVPGLGSGGELQLEGLPFSGSVLIGKKNMPSKMTNPGWRWPFSG